MMNNSDSKNEIIGRTISQRTGYGPSNIVKGWQSILENLLNQLSPYLQPSRIVTFRDLSPSEMQMFEQITQRVEVPDSSCGVYLSPGARNRMLYTNQGHKIPDSARNPTDDGVLLFTRPATRSIILNVLLAHSPYTPAIDVYDRGTLLAGYVYDSIDDCLNSITDVIGTYLGKT